MPELDPLEPRCEIDENRPKCNVCTPVDMHTTHVAPNIDLILDCSSVHELCILFSFFLHVYF